MFALGYKNSILGIDKDFPYSLNQNVELDLNLES
jgi:hypothetical protein